jgi:uncharacterized protein (TIGR02996 family)
VLALEGLTMRRFEFRDGQSAKFWAIELAGRSFTVSYGKIGSAGQTQTKDFPDDAQAKKEHDKLVAEKIAKGYREITAAAAPPPAAAPAPAAATPEPTEEPVQAAAALPARPPAPASAERTFLCSTTKSHKFWNIALQGNRFTITFGKVGGAGETQTKEFPDEERARKEHDKLIWKKQGGGYVETTPRTAAPAEPDQAAGSLREALEAAIRADPEDLVAHSALADYLQEQGDPRGEFIAVQLALEDPRTPAAQRSKLEQREKQLLAAHQRAWTATALPAGVTANEDVDVTVTFRRGQLWGLALESWDYEEEGEQAVYCLAAAPEVGWVRELRIVQEPTSHSLGRLAGAAFAPFLRRLHVGGAENQTKAVGSGVAHLVTTCAALEELAVHAHIGAEEAIRLFAAPMRALRDLAVCCAQHYPLDRLAKNATLTRLRTIKLFPHRLEGTDAAYLNADGLRLLGASKHLTALADLTFKLWSGADAAADALVKTELLFRLERLDLSCGNLTDVGAEKIARALKSHAHRLRFLDLTANAFTPAGAQAIRSAGVEVECKGYHAPNSTEYLASEGDDEWTPVSG